MEQAAHVLRQKKEYDDKNKALMPNLERIKERIQEFNQRKGDLIVSAFFSASHAVALDKLVAGENPRCSRETNEGSACERVLHQEVGR